MSKLIYTLFDFLITFNCPDLRESYNKIIRKIIVKTIAPITIPTIAPADIPLYAA